MEMLRCCIESGIDFERVFILTGQDFPLMSMEKMEESFQNQPSKEYIIGLNMTLLADKDKHENASILKLSLPTNQRERITLYHFRDIPTKRLKNRTKKGISRVLLLVSRTLPFRKNPYLTVNGMRWDVFLASSYMCITMDLAKYIYTTITEHGEIERYFIHSFTPEEMVIPTIVFNSPYRNHAVLYPNNKYEGLIKLSATTYFHYGEKIKTFDETDIEELLSSGRMFARKFSSTKSPRLMDKLKEIWKEEAKTL